LLAERSVEMDPKNGFGYYNLACACASEKRFEEAKKHLQTAIQLLPALGKSAVRDEDLDQVRLAG